jgi:hypothetical protein
MHFEIREIREIRGSIAVFGLRGCLKKGRDRFAYGHASPPQGTCCQMNPAFSNAPARVKILSLFSLCLVVGRQVHPVRRGGSAAAENPPG